MYGKILGYLRMLFHLLSSKNRRILDGIIDLLIKEQNAPKEKLFVLMVGFSKSGKTTYIENDEKLKKLFKLSTIRIHEVINNKFIFLKDDNTVNGRAYWERQFLTRLVRKKILNKVLSQGIAVINDSANLRKQERTQRLKIAKKYNYKTEIVWVVCKEQTLLKRLKDLDRKLEKEGKKPTWVDLYNNVQKDRFNQPTKEETDKLSIVETDQSISLIMGS